MESAILASLRDRDTVPGFDISHYQSTVDFTRAHSAGLRFVIIKATESTNYVDPKFSEHYTGATKAGFIRGGYHFARPGSSSGAAQANYFLRHGGGWSADGITLPGMLDLEDDRSGLSTSAMVAWIQDFVNTYHAATTRYPILYTNRGWWQTCTGGSSAFASTCPLHLASWNSAPGAIPGGWGYQTIWQYNDSCEWGGDSDAFNGSLGRLKVLAKGS
ncbi:glycoside hydrolase family 25 protein [Glonium stellatum]|uniref:N,O-diacetylmuramidase n=1 Tax=Glonium stellatum TaxID=574774 RepID=A0A8E2EWB5_9PEZI|nr:glycoside hydrolase family 25 protein [Glonium stellatum]